MNKRMREILGLIEAKRNEAKAFKDEKKFDDATTKLAEIADLQKEYEVEKALYEAEEVEIDMDKILEGQAKALTEIEKDEKAFVNYVKGTEKSLAQGANGAIVPRSISSKIIEDVKDLSPIYAMVTKYNAKGTFEIPVYGADGGKEINAAYQGSEFTELSEASGKFTSVELNGYSMGSLALISKKLINNTDVDVLAFIRRKMAEAFANKFESELLVGTGTNAMTGAINTTNLNVLTTKTLTGITLDTLIDTQLKVKKSYQKNACWIMNEAVFNALRKVKDNDGRYIMTSDVTTGFNWMLLGKPVYTSESMPAVGAGTVPLLYGDFSGMAMKVAKDVEIQLLMEKYVTQNAIGVVGWAEVDSKIENAQKIVGLKMSAA